LFVHNLITLSLIPLSSGRGEGEGVGY